MQRYTKHTDCYSGAVEMWEDNDGDWVLHSEAMEEIVGCNSALARQQYNDLQLLADRDEKILYLERDVKGLEDTISEYYSKELDKTRAKLIRLTDLINDDKRMEKVVKNINYLDDYLVESYMKHAINDYRAMLKEETEK